MTTGKDMPGQSTPKKNPPQGRARWMLEVKRELSPPAPQSKAQRRRAQHAERRRIGHGVTEAVGRAVVPQWRAGDPAGGEDAEARLSTAHVVNVVGGIERDVAAG